MPRTDFFSIRPTSGDYADYMEAYVSKVPEGSIIQHLRMQVDQVSGLFTQMTDEEAAFRYAAGKWSLKQVVGHLTDSERVFVYRALRFARQDATELPGFDENEYADNGSFDRRSIADLLTEWVLTRRSSISFFATLGEEAWDRSGVASGSRCTVRGLAFVIAGHVEHHRRVILERYLPNMEAHE